MLTASLRRIASAARSTSRGAWRSADYLDDNPSYANGVVFVAGLLITSAIAGVTFWKVTHREHE